MQTRHTLTLCVAVLLLTAGCQLGDGSKPLMGGNVKDSGKQQRLPAGAAGPEADAADGGAPVLQWDAEDYMAPVASEQVLRRTGYVTSYNAATRQPNWVAWTLTAAHTQGETKRPRKAFAEDPEVSGPRAVDADYYDSGYDRGHMCPAADNKWSEEAMLQSFLFTNICPQDHGLNIGDWNEMENQCRRWAVKYGEIVIVCGPILYKTRHKTIGQNKVVVPEAFFKVVLRMQPEPEAIGFIYKNVGGDRPKGDYMNTVDQVERITGYDFFPALPDDVEKKVEATASLDNW